MEKTFAVRADHPSERFCFDGVMTATQDADPARGWYVSAQPYGTSKNAPTPEEAIKNMLFEHGCDGVRVRLAYRAVTFNGNVVTGEGSTLADAKLDAERKAAALGSCVRGAAQ